MLYAMGNIMLGNQWTVYAHYNEINIDVIYVVTLQWAIVSAE